MEAAGREQRLTKEEEGTDACHHFINAPASTYTIPTFPDWHIGHLPRCVVNGLYLPPLAYAMRVSFR
jgi:hypothetical protein